MPDQPTISVFLLGALVGGGMLWFIGQMIAAHWRNRTN
jgi:hypothetical protein